METHINFEDASAAWRANKIRKGEGFVYKCEECKKPATNVRGESKHFYCAYHCRQALLKSFRGVNKN